MMREKLKMISRNFQCALVGSYFRPPAKLVLASLPGGSPLRLEREGQNPYDSAAVRVFVNLRQVEISQSALEELQASLPGAGFDLDEILAQGEVWLGYLAASEKLIEPGQVKNTWVAEIMDSGRLVVASLTASVSGKPSVLVRCEERT